MKPKTLCLVLSLLAGPACADGMSASVRYGEYDNYDRLGASLRFAPVWQGQGGNWRATLHPELELARFAYKGDKSGPDSLGQAGVVGMLRVVRSVGALRPYGEIGLGLAAFSGTRLGTRNFSTSLQFSEHLGLGVEFGDAYYVGWQYSHYSNADIDLPNDGLDLNQIVVGARF